MKNLKITKEQIDKLRRKADRDLASGNFIRTGPHQNSKKDKDGKKKNTVKIRKREDIDD